MIVRLLTLLAITLPLAACAAQPASTDTAGAARAEAPRAAPAAVAVPTTPAPAPAAAAAQPATAQPDNHEADQPTSVTPAGRMPAVRTPAASHAANGRTAAPATTAAADAGTPATAGTVAQPAPAMPATGPVATPAPASPASPAPGTTMPAGSPTGSLLQTLFALVLVLAVLAALAWFLKRYGPRAGGATANLRVVGSLSLGGRERLLVVEVGNQWIVVGASPGRVNALATMPKQEGAAGVGDGAALAPHVPAANNFADWLRQTIDKRK